MLWPIGYKHFDVYKHFRHTAQGLWLIRSFNLFSKIRSSKKENEKEKKEEPSSTKKFKKKIEVSPHFQDHDFYKSTKYSRLTVFDIIYAGRNFIKISSHQPHSEEFMPYLETLVEENPTWADDTNLDTMKWKEIIYVLKAIWRRYKNIKNWKDFELMVSLERTICDSYLEFQN